MNTIREIIIHNSQCLRPYLKKLLPLLIDHSKNEDENIRNVVAENFGRLFVFHSSEMLTDIDKAMKSSDTLIRRTIIKSFKYAGHQGTDSVNLGFCAGDLIKMIKDSDLQVKQNALESLSTIVHNHREVLKEEVAVIVANTVPETVIKPELISEVDLGPFKHKVDNGLPIRKAAF